MYFSVIYYIPHIVICKYKQLSVSYGKYSSFPAKSEASQVLCQLTPAFNIAHPQ